MRRGALAIACLVVAGAAAVAAACGGKIAGTDSAAGGAALDPVVAATSHESGRRLRAHVLAADRVEAFVEWFDTDLGVACAFQTAEDGELRCLPSVVHHVFCSPEVIEDTPAGPPPPPARDARRGEGPAASRPDALVWGARYDGACGDVRTTIYRAGAETAPPTRCDGEPYVPAPGTYEPYAAVRVPPERFVRGAFVVEPRGARLSARVIVAEDGAREVAGIFDDARGETCVAASVGVAVSRSSCVPERFAWLTGRYFDVATCAASNGVAYAFDGCPAPEVVLTDQGCADTTSEVFAVGDRVDDAFMLSAHGCEPDRSGTPGWGAKKAFYRVRTPMPPGALATITAAARGEGRVRLRAWTDDAGVAVRAIGELEDTAGAVPGACVTAPVGDVLRCLPPDVDVEGPEGLFADSSCSEPLVAEQVAVDGCGRSAKPLPRLVLVGSELRALGERFTGAAFSNAGTDACHATTVPDKDDVALFRVGESAADASSFAVITERVE